MKIEAGAEAIFKRMTDINGRMISSPMDIICKKHEELSWSDEVTLQILVEFATIAKKCNHKDDADKNFIKQSILDHAPTPFDIVTALKMGLIWEYGIEDLVEQNPGDDLIVADELTGLYPCMLAAASSSSNPHVDLKTIYTLLMSCPADVLTNAIDGKK